MSLSEENKKEDKSPKKPKTTEASEKKAPAKCEDTESLLEHLKMNVIKYGDPSPGENPKWADQRERAKRWLEIAEKKLK